MVGAKGRQKMNLEHLAISEIKRLLKKNDRGMSQVYGSQPKQLEYWNIYYNNAIMSHWKNRNPYHRQTDRRREGSYFWSWGISDHHGQDKIRQEPSMGASSWENFDEEQHVCLFMCKPLYTILKCLLTDYLLLQRRKKASVIIHWGNQATLTRRGTDRYVISLDVTAKQDTPSSTKFIGWECRTLTESWGNMRKTEHENCI